VVRPPRRSREDGDRRPQRHRRRRVQDPPHRLGTQTVKVTARSETADAVIKSIILEPEGVQREQIANGVLTPGATKTIDLPLPGGIVADSERAYVAITGSLLAQTIEGLDQLLQMPYGCGEQNMLLFAPDAYILKYLKGTSQLKPEIQAKAETLLITGYQRELTYRRSDGSFSAFGDSDPEGSLFLTAFVLKTFAQANGLIYVDDAVLADAAAFIAAHQNADGSFDDVGFVIHTELMGGVQGRDALTAYAATAMIEAGQTDSANRAIAYLEGRLDAIEGDYALALLTYALELADSPKAAEAYAKLMAAAEEDEDGLHWEGTGPVPLIEEQGRGFAPFPGQMGDTTGIEATAYGVLALTAHGDQFNAGSAAKWLVAHRNSLGGFGSTQDTVVALQALTQFAASAASDTDMTVTVRAGDVAEEVRITPTTSTSPNSSRSRRRPSSPSRRRAPDRASTRPSPATTRPPPKTRSRASSTLASDSTRQASPSTT
jgi:CD109 antigen